MGRGSDAMPITISNVIARKHSSVVPTPKAVNRVFQRSNERHDCPAVKATDDEYVVQPASQDPVRNPSFAHVKIYSI